LTSSDSRAREGLDLPGAGLIVVGFACITLALSFSQEWSWMRLLACFLIGLVMLVAAGLVDRRGAASAGRALILARSGPGTATDVVALQHAFMTGFRGTLLVCAGA
jgi:hypothetical protein